MLRFTKAHHKISRRRKVGVEGDGIGELSKILEFPFNISATPRG